MRWKEIMEDAGAVESGKAIADYLPEAQALLMKNAIEMYIEEGHSQEEAEKLAQILLESPAQFKLPAAVTRKSVTGEGVSISPTRTVCGCTSGI